MNNQNSHLIITFQYFTIIYPLEVILSILYGESTV